MSIKIYSIAVIVLPANFVSNASSSRSSKAANARRAPAIFASFLLLPVPYNQNKILFI
jgi:hypothetical protein